MIHMSELLAVIAGASPPESRSKDFETFPELLEFYEQGSLDDLESEHPLKRGDRKEIKKLNELGRVSIELQFYPELVSGLRSSCPQLMIQTIYEQHKLESFHSSS